MKQLALVMSRFPIEWLAGMNSRFWGGPASGLQWNMTHSFTHSYIYTHLAGDSGVGCWPPPIQMIQS